VRVIAGDVTTVEADAVVVNLFEGVEKPGGATAAVDGVLGGAIGDLIARGELRGKPGELAIVHTLGKLPATMVAVAGLGKAGDLSVERIRGASGEFCRQLRKLNCRRVVTVLHGAGAGGLTPELSAEAISMGAFVGLYSFDRYKKPEYSDLDELLIVTQDERAVAGLERAVRKGRIMAEATNLARDMVNEPASNMTPTRMAEMASELAATQRLELKVLEADDMRAMGMDALLGVARGSVEPPKLMVLSYRGNAASESAVGVLGKGITFDSGGISIKPAEGMGEMKDDMAGGAAVLAALSAIAQFGPRINVTGIVPATENLPSGSAFKPGDVLKSMNGKTIEVITTDAEGRLILADALSYARKLGLSPLIDLATLTGACRVALGTLYSGLFGNDGALQEKLLAAAERSGDRLWRMPMPEEYREQIKSDIADVKNIGNRYAGAITAALFLEEFVDGSPSAHIDIAGTALSAKEKGYAVKGASGVGVRTIIEYVLAEAENGGAA